MLEGAENLKPRKEKPKSVTDSTTKDVVVSAAVTNTPAKLVEVQITASQHANLPQRIELCGMRPRYLRYNVWDPNEKHTLTTAEWTETAKPLPRPSPEQLMHPVVRETIEKNPELFKIVTPVKIEVFEDLLRDHPNRPFVKSVCDGFKYGFWPWADIWKADYPETLDLSLTVQADADREKFFHDQAAVELAKERYSPSLGSTLLPGMYCMPIYAVPKPHSDKLRLVNDHSASSHSLNSMINHDEVTGYPMDSLAKFGNLLIDFRKHCPDILEGPGPITVWKSDIEGAYRLCPLHPFWQIKQAVRIGKNFHIDRCIAFGSSASPAIFIAFNSLVTWIAKYKRGITFITTYIDDSSGCAWADDTAYYAPYDRHLPSPQTRLLTLWDDLGIPHQERKQIHGASIPVIGIQVNPNTMTYTLPSESQAKLIGELEMWVTKGKHTVRRWQHMAGWINWCLNVYPLLRPALCNVYNKLRFKSNPSGSVWVNNAVRDDLSWALSKIRSSPGRHLLESTIWTVEDATFTIFCDACPAGMGFWYPALNLGFYARTPEDDLEGLLSHDGTIFYFEALCVVCALRDACQFTTDASGRFVIYTDNFNTVDIFASLSALPAYNVLIREAMNLIYDKKHNLRVLHVRGEENTVADALSRANFDLALQLQPDLTIHEFEPYVRLKKDDTYSLKPPRETLGAAKK
jgi:hypothetical protein